MSAKFFIYGGRRWRELDTESGRISGWGRAKFVFVQRGRLVVARRGSVLRALRALATGRGGAAQDGLPLSKYVPPAAANEKKKNKSPVRVPCKECQRHHEHVVLRQHCIQCMNDARFDRLVNLNTNTVGIQCVATANASVQVTQSLTNRRSSINNSDENLALSRIASQSNRNQKGKFVKTQSHLNKKSANIARITEKTLEAQTDNPKFAQSKRQSVDILQKKTDNSSINRKRKHSPSSDSTSSKVTYSQKESEEEVKELVIDEKDVELLRRFLLKNNFGVDVEQFDKSEAYKEKVFYSINPLVLIERCPRIKQMLTEQQNQANGVSIKHFMSVLGLQTIEERNSQERRYKTRARVSQIINSMSNKDVFVCENNKENESVPKKVERKVDKKPAKVLREDNVRLNHLKSVSQEIVKDPPSSNARISSPRSQAPRARMLKERVVELSSNSSSSSDGEAFQAPPSAAPSRPTRVNSGRGGSSGSGSGKLRRGRGGGAREYSALEDAAIVSWIRAGNRARLVNGNRLWRELQSEYTARTGTTRSWHSLRNRYLRYILPALQRLALPHDATRLRAAAAAGELKSRKQQSQNSMLVLPRVRSAWARRRRTRQPTPSPTSSPTPSPTRSHRQERPNASTPKSAEKSTRSQRTPMYSELTRHFANADIENSSDDFERTEATAPPRIRTSPLHRLRGRTTPQSVSTAESRSQRHSRRSTRNNTDKEPSPDHSLKEDAPKKRRRLYNPKTAL